MNLGITLGDASGVGPEIVLKAFSDNALPRNCVVIGDEAVLKYCAESLKCFIKLNVVASLTEIQQGCLNVFDMKLLKKEDITPGKLNQKSGQAALQYLKFAVRAALENKISAIVTLPMNKEATRLSTPGFTGHTEIIQEMCGNREFTMTLASDKLLVTHVSSHVSLKEAIERVKQDRILKVITLTHDALTKLGRKKRIAVMGLNPHAGENGAFGNEEKLDILPAIQAAQSKGINAIGPLPPDTVFMKALNGEYDGVVCMYHDQGHIPMKTVGFHDTVQLTFGLPIVRTSVDHGTAFDIAYKGIASTGSFIAACKMAELLAR
jgi:4-phospho-D-threonate 3-dehydrogenase / 4-phospho-D-erythronate 3-dehydrogenase